MRLAIIPARSGSTRIKDKNIIDFFGKPLIYYPLTAAKESGLFDTIHVSTESQKYIDVVDGLGYPVDFPRIDALAENQVNISELLLWIVDEYQKRDQSFSEICLIYATAPLLDASDLKQAYEVFIQHGREVPVLSVASFPAPVERGYVVGENGLLRPVCPEKRKFHSQDLLTNYHDAGMFCFMCRQQLLDNRLSVFESVLPYVLPRHKVIDIDEPEDLEVAKILYLGRQAMRNEQANKE